MLTRNDSAKIGGGVVVIVAAIASCSFPTYDIQVTGGSTGATTAASGSSASVSGSGGASTTASSGSVGGASTTASSGSVGGAGGGSGSGTSSATSTSSGPCSTDADGDGAISWQCANGKDCADQDNRAHPGADFTIGPAIAGPLSPGTLPYDFNCDFLETKKTPTLSCVGAVCPTPVTTKGFLTDVACGASGVIGHCAGIPCGWVSDSANTTEVCK